MRLLIFLILAILLVAIVIVALFSRMPPMQFSQSDALLERAIQDDNPTAIRQASASGANVNAKGAFGVTPISFAVGTKKKQAAAALLALGADPNPRDDEGDNAVTLAVTQYKTDPDLLRMVLDRGGDPNSKRPDGDPVIVRFINDANLEGIGLLHSKGADLNAEASGQPLVVFAAYTVAWDVVWQMIELGADLSSPKVQHGLVEAFKVPGATLPDSPLYPAKVKVWRHLVGLGLNPVPPAGMQHPTLP